MDQVSSLLENARLDAFLRGFQSLGIQDASDFEDVTPGDLVGLGMNTLQQRRFFSHVMPAAKALAAAAPPVPPPPPPAVSAPAQPVPTSSAKPVSTSSFTAARRRSTIMTKFRAVQVFRKPPPTVAEHESGSEDGSSDGEGRAGATAEVQRQRQLQRPRPRPHAQSLDEDGLSPTDALAAVMNPSLAKEIMSRRSQHRAAEAAAGGGGGGGGQPPPQQQASQEPVVGYAAVHGRNLRGRGAVGGRDSATTTATTTTRRVRTHVPTPGRRVAWADRVSATAAHPKAAKAAPDGERHEPHATVPAAAVARQDGHDSAGSSDEVPPTIVIAPDAPPVLQSSFGAGAAERAAGMDLRVEPSPPAQVDWQEVQDPNGYLYYHHKPSDKVQWEPPAEPYTDVGGTVQHPPLVPLSLLPDMEAVSKQGATGGYLSQHQNGSPTHRSPKHRRSSSGGSTPKHRRRSSGGSGSTTPKHQRQRGSRRGSHDSPTHAKPRKASATRTRRRGAGGSTSSKAKRGKPKARARTASSDDASQRGGGMTNEKGRWRSLWKEVVGGGGGGTQQQPKARGSAASKTSESSPRVPRRKAPALPTAAGRGYAAAPAPAPAAPAPAIAPAAATARATATAQVTAPRPVGLAAAAEARSRVQRAAPWSSSLRGGPSKKDAHAKAPTTREAYKQLLSLTVYESGSDGPNPRSPGEGYVNNHSPRQPTPADHAEAAAPSGGKRKVRKKKMTVFDRLTDVRSYTGTHRERFDESGHGRGLVGRERWELDMDDLKAESVESPLSLPVDSGFQPKAMRYFKF